KILRLRDAIHPDDATTPVKRLCYAAQLVVAGEAEPEPSAQELTRGIGQLREALGSIAGVEALDDALGELRRRNFYGCLRNLRRLLPLEEILLAGRAAGAVHARAPAPAQTSAQATAPSADPGAGASGSGVADTGANGGANRAAHGGAVNGVAGAPPADSGATRATLRLRSSSGEP
ncbi:MAG: flagellar biosynthesis repressor FlbT, partial [Pseudomonadota bacterium]